MFLPQRDPAMVFLFFIPSKLVEGIKRGESALEFSLRFSSYRSACQQPIGTRFLRAIHKKNRELYGVEFCVPSLQIFVPSSFPSFFLGFLPSFFSLFAADTIYSRTIEFLLSTWTITRVSENNLSPFAIFSRTNYGVLRSSRKLNRNNCKMKNISRVCHEHHSKLNYNE